MDGFEEVFPCSTGTKRSEAIWSAVIHSGLGPLSPNMVMLSWPQISHHTLEAEDYVATLKGLMNMKKAIVLFKGDDRYPHERKPVQNGAVIDIWWVVHDGGLLLLLPYLLCRNPVWRNNTKLRVFAVRTSNTENPDRLFQAVTDHLRKARIIASVTVVDLSHTSISNHMREVDCVRIRNSPHAEVDASHATVGEFFSDQVYEIPYMPMGAHQIQTVTGGTDDDHYEHEYGDEHGDEHGDGDLMFQVMEEKLVNTDTAKSGPDDFHEKNYRETTALEINKTFLQHSRMANLVVTNMPFIRPGQPASYFLNYVEAMSGGLGNVVFVRGTGAEVITTYA